MRNAAVRQVCAMKLTERDAARAPRLTTWKSQSVARVLTKTITRLNTQLLIRACVQWLSYSLETSVRWSRTGHNSNAGTTERDPVPVIKYWWSLIGESEILQLRERERVGSLFTRWIEMDFSGFGFVESLFWYSHARINLRILSWLVMEDVHSQLSVNFCPVFEYLVFALLA